MTDTPSMEAIVSLCTRRGFVAPTAAMYGGANALHDFGPLGARMRWNIRQIWKRDVVDGRGDVEYIESAILTPAPVLRASGHLATFTDPVTECASCQRRWRVDQIVEQRADRGKDARLLCPEDDGVLGEAEQFNLMFSTQFGPSDSSSELVYLRPETAQGSFTNFEVTAETMRRRLPFGIAQIGKSFRNEITAGRFIFRGREFEQMELEYFCTAETAVEWHEYWAQARLDWYADSLGLRQSRVRIRDLPREDLAHYSAGTKEIEYRFPFGWGEIEGVANRGDFDLRSHGEHAHRDLGIEDGGQRVRPHVIEPACGVDRLLLAALIDGYEIEQVRDRERVVLRLHPDIAPFQIAVLPLLRKQGMPELAHEVATGLRPGFVVTEDTTQEIGKRYRRQDEIGTPLCVTIDGESATDGMVTIRQRDSMAQIRVPIAGLDTALREELGAMRFAARTRARDGLGREAEGLEF